MTAAKSWTWLLLLLAFSWAMNGPASSQELAEIYGAEAPDTALVAIVDSMHADEGITIDSVIIEPREIYDTTDQRYRRRLFRLANRLHIVTKPTVIKRELLLKSGEPFVAQKAEEMARNLRTRYKLVDAWVETERLPNGHLLLRVVTIDQWSLVGGGDITRDGNRTRFKFGFEERNLLGYNQFVSFDWVLQEADDDYIHTKFRDLRFFGIPYSVVLEHNTDPLNELTLVGISRPFYSLDQQFSFGTSVSRLGGRHDVYDDSILLGAWQGNADQFDIFTEYRWGDHLTKLGIGTWYTYRFDQVTERIGGSIDFPSDSLYHQPAVSLKLAHADYLRMRRINNFSLLEDVTLTTGVELLLGRAFTSDFENYFYDKLEVTAMYGQKFGENLLLTDHQYTYWYKGERQYRTRTRTSARFYNNSLPFMTVAMRLQYRTDFFDSDNEPLILGGTSGLRGYDQFALTGDRALAFNVETRWFPGIEVLSAMIGGALFADIGRAWKQGEQFAIRDLEHTIGAGLRISLEKATRSEIIRFDVSVTRQGDVQLAFGTGQYF
jgi:hypothetical protein